MLGIQAGCWCHSTGDSVLVPAAQNQVGHRQGYGLRPSAPSGFSPHVLVRRLTHGKRVCQGACTRAPGLAGTASLLFWLGVLHTRRGCGSATMRTSGVGSAGCAPAEVLVPLPPPCRWCWGAIAPRVGVIRREGERPGSRFPAPRCHLSAGRGSPWTLTQRRLRALTPHPVAVRWCPAYRAPSGPWPYAGLHLPFTPHRRSDECAP